MHDEIISKLKEAIVIEYKCIEMALEAVKYAFI